jgi:hypothetical protein
MFATSPIRLLGKKALRQQRGSPVGEGLFPLPTANGEAVGEEDGVGTVSPRRGFANSFSFPTAFLLGKNPFANRVSLPSVLGFWAVGEDFFPGSGVFLLGKSFVANSSGLGCWENSGLLAKPQFPVVCDTLLRLMLQDNQLLGEVPKGLGTGQLIWLLLRNNRFTWSLPAIIPRTLAWLDIGNNHFVGRIPSAGFKFAEFTANNNQFSGEIPANLAYDMPRLQKTNLANNKLSGVIS